MVVGGGTGSGWGRIGGGSREVEEGGREVEVGEVEAGVNGGNQSNISFTILRDEIDCTKRIC